MELLLEIINVLSVRVMEVIYHGPMARPFYLLNLVEVFN